MEHLLLTLPVTVFELGCIYALVVLAVYVTSRVINIDDFTVEGSFATGGAITATLLLHALHPLLTVVCAMTVGALVGCLTGLLHTKLSMHNLISGIVVTTALFSINLKTVGSHAIIAPEATLFACLPLQNNALVLGCACFLMVGMVHWFLKTEVGFCLRAVGGNALMVTALGKSATWYKILGFMLANSLSACAGSLLVQHTCFFSITGSIGTLIIALAGLIIGTTLSRTLFWSVVGGAFLYQFIIACTIELQFDPIWNKMITALLIVMIMACKQCFKDKRCLN